MTALLGGIAILQSLGMANHHLGLNQAFIGAAFGVAGLQGPRPVACAQGRFRPLDAQAGCSGRRCTGIRGVMANSRLNRRASGARVGFACPRSEEYRQ